MPSGPQRDELHVEGTCAGSALLDAVVVSVSGFAEESWLRWNLH